MRLIATLALALSCASLAACQPPASAGQVAATAHTDLDRAQTAYDAAKAWADLLAPLLPDSAAAAIVRAEATAEHALATARAAATIAERTAALVDAIRATKTLTAAAKAPPAVDER